MVPSAVWRKATQVIKPSDEEELAAGSNAAALRIAPERSPMTIDAIRVILRLPDSIASNCAAMSQAIVALAPAVVPSRNVSPTATSAVAMIIWPRTSHPVRATSIAAPIGSRPRQNSTQSVALGAPWKAR